MRRHFIIYLLFFVGCATGGVNFNTQLVTEITPKVTNNKNIINMFGKPVDKYSHTVKSSTYNIFEYSYVMGTFKGGKVRYLHVEFLNEIVNGYIFVSSFDKDSTDFNSDLNQKITPKNMSKSDIRRIAGNPSGIIHLPTALLKHLFGTTDIPQDASEAWSYYYGYVEKEHNLLNKKFKLLLLYFNSDGNLIDKTYSGNI